MVSRREMDIVLGSDVRFVTKQMFFAYRFSIGGGLGYNESPLKEFVSNFYLLLSIFVRCAAGLRTIEA